MTLASMMLAMEITAPGGPDVLQPVSVPVPVPGHGQIVVRLAYVGVNRPDSWYFTGSYGRDDEILLSNHGDAYLIPKPGGTLILWTGYYEFSRVTIPWPHSIHLPTIEK